MTAGEGKEVAVGSIWGEIAELEAIDGGKP